jgi:hypothetical protein
MGSHQQIEKQTEEKGLTRNSKQLKKSMDGESFLGQNSISPGNRIVNAAAEFALDLKVTESAARSLRP